MTTLQRVQQTLRGNYSGTHMWSLFVLLSNHWISETPGHSGDREREEESQSSHGMCHYGSEMARKAILYLAISTTKYRKFRGQGHLVEYRQHVGICIVYSMGMDWQMMSPTIPKYIATIGKTIATGKLNA